MDSRGNVFHFFALRAKELVGCPTASKACMLVCTRAERAGGGALGFRLYPDTPSPTCGRTCVFFLKVKVRFPTTMNAMLLLLLLGCTKNRKPRAPTSLSSLSLVTGASIHSVKFSTYTQLLSASSPRNISWLPPFDKNTHRSRSVRTASARP